MKEKNVVFETPAGTIIGWEDELVIRATGIPYAYAARFEKPHPYPIFQEPYNANTPSPAPPQGISQVTNSVLGFDLLHGLKMDEHCQSLSVTIPKNLPQTARIPVMIWLYGGSYTTGAGDALSYDPKYLAAEQQVIVVNVNYRLGILGFVGGIGRPSNLGLFDVIAAIRWVNHNIAAFGGDPQKVTLFGQSAGGDAVAHAMIADGTKGLFQRVIVQSAPLGLRHQKQKMTAAMKQMAGTITSNTPLSEILALQATIAGRMKKFGLNGGMPFGVEYGQAPLPAEQQAMQRWKDRAASIDVLIGCADNETALFVPFIKPLSFLQQIPFIGKPLIRVLAKKLTSLIYLKPATTFAAELASDPTAKVYHYLISWGRENGLGAVHIIDIPLLFGDETICKTSMLTKGMDWSKVYADGKQLRAVWGAFARSGELEDQINLPGLLSCHCVKGKDQ